MNDLTKIKHVVVLSMENRSFDHVLGALDGDPDYPNRDRVDGITKRLTNLDDHGEPHRGDHLTGELARVFKTDPPHDSRRVALQMALHDPSAQPMTGFVRAFRLAHPKGDDDERVLGFLDGTDVPVTYALARHFAVCQRWFASVPTQTIPNRLYLIAGHSKRLRDNPPAEEYVKGIDITTIFDLLPRNDWTVYCDALPLAALVRNLRDDLFVEKKLASVDDFVKQAGDGTLPKLCWIEPTYSWADFPLLDPFLPEPNDDHPPSPVDAGQRLIRRVYSALMKQSVWESCVFIVTYDEHGGFSDHVVPPPRPVEDDFDVFETRGLRVPTLVISPFVEPGSLHGDPADEPSGWDHCSILKFLCEWRGLDAAKLSPRVASPATRSVREMLTDDARIPVAPQVPPAPGASTKGILAKSPVATSSAEAGRVPPDANLTTATNVGPSIVRLADHDLARTFESLRQGILESHPTELTELRPQIASANVVDPAR